ncbi:hypothetical protein WJX72_011564 [[Myrmecia] bisecta]|uniref:Succinate dehydrogenase [ubiquinone] cytochrome b small subunit n=1 Tax=[Myrmecia] bisecta TaxID=41462 RepID=A0AAW1QSX2_9CHLO
MQRFLARSITQALRPHAHSTATSALALHTSLIGTSESAQPYTRLLPLHRNTTRQSSAQHHSRVAKWLGYAGAIPFLALSPPIASMIPLMPSGLIADAAVLQLGYGACIASFLGGIHWAMAMARYGGPALSGLSVTLGWDPAASPQASAASVKSMVYVGGKVSSMGTNQPCASGGKEARFTEGNNALKAQTAGTQTPASCQTHRPNSTFAR